jgi:hypothetical protein
LSKEPLDREAIDKSEKLKEKLQDLSIHEMWKLLDLDFPEEKENND